MVTHTASRSGHTTQSAARELKAMLRLIEDLGYEVQASPTGDWTVATRDDRGDRTVIGVDSAQEVATAARQLAGSLQVDHHLAKLDVLA
jgi:hypothetical protein